MRRQISSFKPLCLFNFSFLNDDCRKCPDLFHVTSMLFLIFLLRMNNHNQRLVEANVKVAFILLKFLSTKHLNSTCGVACAYIKTDHRSLVKRCRLQNCTSHCLLLYITRSRQNTCCCNRSSNSPKCF